MSLYMYLYDQPFQGEAMSENVCYDEKYDDGCGGETAFLTPYDNLCNCKAPKGI